MKWQIYILLLLVLPEAWGQGLCDNANAVKNGFKLDANAGCSPFSIEPENLMTDWTDVNYIFDYRGQAAEDLPNLNPSQQDVLFNKPDGSIATYTILQFGKDANGLERYSCQNVAVRKDNQPKFSYNSCNNRILNVTIPDVIENDFDSYIIDWGDGTRENFNKTPFQKTKSYSTLQPTRQIKIEGVYNVPAACAVPNFQTVQMSEGGNYANIDLLDLSVKKDMIKADFNGLNEDYQLFKRKVGEAYDNGSPEQIISSGLVDLNIDPNLQFCFSAFRNSGGCFESAGEVCTISLDAEIDGKTNVLKWDSHPIVLNTLMGANGEVQNVSYNIIRSGESIEYINNAASPFVDQIDCTKDYCYRIETIVEGIPKFGSAIKYKSISLSNEVCLDRETFRPNSINTLSASFDGDQSHVVSFIDDSNWSLNKTQYYLYQFNSKGDSVLIDSASQVQDLHSSEINNDCYGIAYRDECQSLSKLSPIVCTVELDVKSDEQLIWDSNSPFSSESIDSYDVFALNENTLNYDFLTDRSNASNDLSPDLSNYLNEARFKVKVNGTNGSVSWTNSKFIPLDFKLFLPDAFSPNGDGENDILQLKGSLGRAEAISFEVYDRWGKLIYVSDSQNLKWDATLDGKLIPIGQYIYQFKAQLKDGSSYKQNGFIQILK